MLLEYDKQQVSHLSAAQVFSDFYEPTVRQQYMHIRNIAREHQVPLDRKILDLCCGAGNLARHLVQEAQQLAGMDTIPEETGILTFAMNRPEFKGRGNVHIRRQDFRRQFFLEDQTFDLVVCFADCLNLVENPRQLDVVFQNVATHLEPGGYFLGDFFSARFWEKQCGSWKFTSPAGDYMFISEYDRERRVVQSTLVLLPEAPGEQRIEYRQVPLEPKEVISAADNAGLKLVNKWVCRLEKGQLLHRPAVEIPEGDRELYYILLRKEKQPYKNKE